MENKLTSRFKKAWNAFFNKDPTRNSGGYYDNGPSYYSRPDRLRLTRGNERSIITAIYNRIAMDVAAIDIFHVRLDENGRFKEVINSGLNNCLTIEANLDQTGRELRQDIVMSMFDEGAIAIVPVDTDKDPEDGSFDVLTLRTGKIKEWFPQKVRLEIYNELTGRHEDIIMDKKAVAIVENPFYSIMNEPNSTLQRLKRKLLLLDVIDEQSSSGKFNLIIQLPYSLRSDYHKNQAEERRHKIEEQLTDNKYGIAYIDATEHVTQLNRPLENNLMSQIEYLTNMLYSQLGITQSVLEGTADEQTMLNYYNGAIEPVISAIVNAMIRNFLTKTARTQGQSIKFFRDAFKLIPVGQIAEIADKFTRNEIASPNEMRQIVGWKPSEDKNADQLRNRNINQSNNEIQSGMSMEGAPADNDQVVEELLNSLELSVDDIIGRYSEDGDENEK